MTFYLVTVAAKVDDAGQPVSEDAGGNRVVKELNVWDDRDQAELADGYAQHRVLHLHKLGYQHSTGRPLEWRGEISIYAPFLISIEVDLKAERKQKAGPVDFVPRAPARPAQ